MPHSATPVDFRPVTDFTRGDLKKFDCGNSDMNNYLHRGLAAKNHKTDQSPCLIIVPRDRDDPIFGYVTLTNATVDKANLPVPQYAGFPNYPVPVTLIARLAVSVDHQRKGFGRRLLMHVFFNQYQTVRKFGIGSVGVITDAIDQNAVDFYTKSDFLILPGVTTFPMRMFIPNETFFGAI